MVQHNEVDAPMWMQTDVLPWELGCSFEEHHMTTHVIECMQRLQRQWFAA